MTKKDAPNITGLVIDKEEFVKASLDFLGYYGRLPYMKEDDVLITDHGHEVLSKNIIKSVKDIEETMKKFRE